MEKIIKYVAPMFKGELARSVLRAGRYGADGKSTGFDVDQYGRTFVIYGHAAPEAAQLVVKACGGSFQTLT